MSKQDTLEWMQNNERADLWRAGMQKAAIATLSTLVIVLTLLLIRPSRQPAPVRQSLPPARQVQAPATPVAVQPAQSPPPPAVPEFSLKQYLDDKAAYERQQAQALQQQQEQQLQQQREITNSTPQRNQAQTEREAYYSAIVQRHKADLEARDNRIKQNLIQQDQQEQALQQYMSKWNNTPNLPGGFRIDRRQAEHMMRGGRIINGQLR